MTAYLNLMWRTYGAASNFDTFNNKREGAESRHRLLWCADLNKGSLDTQELEILRKGHIRG